MTLIVYCLRLLQLCCVLFTLQRLPLRLRRVHELIYVQHRAFSVVTTFLFIIQLFFPPLSVGEGDRARYVKLIAEEIAVKRSAHFSFSVTFFCPILPLILSFSSRLDF